MNLYILLEIWGVPTVDKYRRSVPAIIGLVARERIFEDCHLPAQVLVGKALVLTVRIEANPR